MVAALTAMVLLVGVLLVRVLTDEDARTPERPGGGPALPPATAGPTPSPTGPAESTPPRTSSVPEEPTGGPAVIPDGFRPYRDPTGFSLAIPEHWIVSRRKHYVYVREPEGNRFLLIDQTDQPKPDAVADWTKQEAARRGSMNDYERIRIGRVDYFLEAADWEFRHTRDGTRLHVINRGFVTSDDQAYGLYWSTPENQWTESQPYFKTFARTFQPAR